MSSLRDEEKKKRAWESERGHDLGEEIKLSHNNKECRESSSYQRAKPWSKSLELELEGRKEVTMDEEENGIGRGRREHGRIERKRGWGIFINIVSFIMKLT